MHYVNEEIIKTFEYLLSLRYKYHSIDTLVSSPRKSRILYRIKQEKLDRYRLQYNSKDDHAYLVLNENKNLHLDGKKTISTQTTFNKEIDLVYPSVNSLSIISKETNELDISHDLSTVSLSLSNTNKTTIENSNSSNMESESEISMKTDFNPIQEYPFNDYSSKPQSTNCRVYIRSIGRHMLDDETSVEENKGYHRLGNQS